MHNTLYDNLKLYQLSVIKDGKSFAEPLSFSHSIDKLTQSILAPGGHWKIIGRSGTHDNIRVRESENYGTNNYPQYIVDEVNFII